MSVEQDTAKPEAQNPKWSAEDQEFIDWYKRYTNYRIANNLSTSGRECIERLISEGPDGVHARSGGLLSCISHLKITVEENFTKTINLNL